MASDSNAYSQLVEDLKKQEEEKKTLETAIDGIRKQIAGFGTSSSFDDSIDNITKEFKQKSKQLKKVDEKIAKLTAEIATSRPVTPPNPAATVAVAVPIAQGSRSSNASLPSVYESARESGVKVPQIPVPSSSVIQPKTSENVKPPTSKKSHKAFIQSHLNFLRSSIEGICATSQCGHDAD